MAELFLKQAKQYAEGRPSYPSELFKFIASKTPIHDLAWDVGTGSGQAARSLSKIYQHVVATDTSSKQLAYAPKLPNIRYEHTSAVMSNAELEEKVAPQSSVDLVTIAQALHWFDRPSFYKQAHAVLKKPHGVVAAWCYTISPEVNNSIDLVFAQFYSDSDPYWNPGKKLIDNEYKEIDFPFEPVEGLESTGPIRFVTKGMMMSLNDYFTYIKSLSAYQTAKDNEVELLNRDVTEKFRQAWNEEGGEGKKIVRFAVYLRIGRVGM